MHYLDYNEKITINIKHINPIIKIYLITYSPLTNQTISLQIFPILIAIYSFNSYFFYLSLFMLSIKKVYNDKNKNMLTMILYFKI